LGPAGELAGLLGADCTLLRVVELPEAAARDSREEAEARAYLGRVAGRLRERGLRAQARVVVGTGAAEAIVVEAQALKGAVIALATHGRGGLRRAVLGSIADRVIRGASCPVLVCRPAAG
jgi:nucleotide-binding universal stress UspA family protein